MSLYSPFYLLFFISLIPLIIMYLLKQKFPEKRISSIYLWQKAVSEIKAQEPWQKLRKNILMILQIIMLTLITLALCKPYFSDIFTSDYNIIVIDSSMSMKATDVKPSRFEYAQKKAHELIESMKPGSFTMIINIASTTSIVSNYDNNKSNLLNKLDKIEATNETTDYEGAKSLIEAMIAKNKNAFVYLFGDTELIIPNLNIKTFKTAENGANFAIKCLSYAETKKSVTYLCQIANYSQKEEVIPLSLYLDNTVYDAKNVTVLPGESKGVFFTGIPQKDALVEARIDREDTLSVDNRAFDVLRFNKPKKVALISKGNVFLEKALLIDKNMSLFKLDETSGADSQNISGYDLYIYDSVSAKTLPSDGNILFINPEENRVFKVIGEIKPTSIKKNEHEILKYLDKLSFSLKKAKKIEVLSTAKIIVDSNEGPLISVIEQNKKRIAIIAFSLKDTDLILKQEFPILISNTLEWLLPGSTKSLQNMKTGESAVFDINNKTLEANVITPEKESYSIFPPYPVKVFGDARNPGFYTLEQKFGDVLDLSYFAVNPPTESESDIKAKSVTFSDLAKQGNTNLKDDEFVNIAFIIIFIILTLLIVEWWVYAIAINLRILQTIPYVYNWIYLNYYTQIQ